jgi:hypothetical protein
MASVELRWLRTGPLGRQVSLFSLPLPVASVLSAEVPLEAALAFWTEAAGCTDQALLAVLKRIELKELAINGKRARPGVMIRAIDRLDLCPALAQSAMEGRRIKAEKNRRSKKI